MIPESERKKYQAMFAEQLNKAMKYRNVSVKELAAAIGRSESSVRRYLKGQSDYGVDILLALSETLNVLPSYLLGEPIMEKETQDIADNMVRSICVDHDWEEQESKLMKKANELTDDQRKQLGDYFGKLLTRIEEKENKEKPDKIT